MDITECTYNWCPWAVYESQPGAFSTATIRRLVYRNLHLWFCHDADERVLREYPGHVDGWIGHRDDFAQLLTDNPAQRDIVIGSDPARALTDCGDCGTPMGDLHLANCSELTAIPETETL